ncbi:MAG: L-2-hydroxyglutarate oxidase [Planctomycetaceae bacterium]|nr:L-2-hydroxyglutarate oxidase [Planctomycetaceae bacterium]
MQQTDVLVIGGGIVGLAAAYQVARLKPATKIVVVEKEPEPARHQTGHNSGVLHSGIYYKPGSLRALNCRSGKRMMEEFCREEGIPFDICGKVIVACGDSELPGLQRIFERGQANGVACAMIDRARLKELEPHTAGIAAIHVPEAGIVNYRAVCMRLVEIVERAGGRFIPNAEVTALRSEANGVAVVSRAGEFQARYVINCTGLQSDRTTKLSGRTPAVKIVPFRGEYFELKPAAKHLCRNLIYPVPDPSFPFLGVHFTRMISGAVECGPNAVLAFAREGYRKRNVSFRDLSETLTYGGFLKLAAKHWRTGFGELWRSFSKRAFVKALQRLIPEIRGEDLETAPAGVRAMALAPDGSIVDDFVIEEHDRFINVCNAPSPAATSSLQIGLSIAERLTERL